MVKHEGGGCFDYGKVRRAYVSQAWLDEFPNFCPQLSPNNIRPRPILLQTEPSTSSFKRPYQVEAWCLNLPGILHTLNEVWQLQISGSPMYSLSKKLFIARELMKVWCLDRRLFQGVNWIQFIKNYESTEITSTLFKKALPSCTGNTSLRRKLQWVFCAGQKGLGTILHA